jgi:hypothetical protein
MNLSFPHPADMHTTAQHGIHLSRRLPSAEHPSYRSDARRQCWAPGACSLRLPLHPTDRRCLGPRCQRARRICPPGRLQPLPAAPGTRQHRSHTGPAWARGRRRRVLCRTMLRGAADRQSRARGHAQGSGGRGKKPGRAAGLRRAHAACLQSLSFDPSQKGHSGRGGKTENMQWKKA